MPAILMRMGNARKHLDYMIHSMYPFYLTTSNYSMKIETYYEAEDGTLEDYLAEEGRKLFLDKKYIATDQSKRTFAAFAKLKSDLKEKKVPKIDPSELIYFQHDFKQSMYIEQVINIDLKSAYATILYNDGYISEETFRYLHSATKKERLASVGMLASRKRIFDFKKGEPVGDPEVHVSPNAGFFFHAVKRTYEIMSELKRICGEDYLFTWVDGIYFLPSWEKRVDCENYLSSVNIKFSTDTLTEFEVKVLANKCLVEFKKEGKRKLFNLPSLSTEFKRISLEAIMRINKKQKQDEQKIASKKGNHKNKKGFQS